MEDLAGLPFIGPAGKLLGQLLDDVSVRLKGQLPPYAITNIVSCIPLSAESRFRTPTGEEAACCRTRLLEFITRVARPSRVVLLGLVAKEQFPYDQLPPYPYLTLYHPSFLLRTGGVKSPHYLQTAADLVTFIKESS